MAWQIDYTHCVSEGNCKKYPCGKEKYKSKGCNFCHLLKDHIGEYVRVGVVCNCDTNNHIYRDGYIQRGSFCFGTIRLFDSAEGGNVIFTACCDDIFEVYLFPVGGNTIDIPTMVEQRLNFLERLQGNSQKEETTNA